jgi:hypothetical protein
MALAVERMSNQLTHVLLIEDCPGNVHMVRGATKEEAEKRVEQWLVAKYAAKFYPQVFPERGKGHTPEGNAMALRSPNQRAPLVIPHILQTRCYDESKFSEVLK